MDAGSKVCFRDYRIPRFIVRIEDDKVILREMGKAQASAKVNITEVRLWNDTDELRFQNTTFQPNDYTEAEANL